MSNTSSMELSHYATILRRRWVYVAGALCLGVLVATALMVTVPSKSTSTTLVNINLISSNAFSASRPPSDLLDMETEQAMARSTTVMNEVAAGLGDGWTKSSVRAATEATLLPNGTVLRIQFTGGSPDEAADGATLVAEKYLAYRSEEAQGRVDSAAERLVVRRDSLRKQLTAANDELSESAAGSQGRLTAELARQTVAEELATVTTQLNELRVVNTGGGSVLTEADARQTQSSPNRPLMLFSGILGGLLSGLVLAFVVNVLDRRVRDPYDVAGAGGGVTVARLAGEETSVPAVGVEAEQIRAVRERVMAATSAERPVLAVIDVGPDDAVPTDVAINLAASLADSGLETDLIIVDHPVDVLVNVLHDLSAREVGARAHVRRFRSRTVPTLQISVPDTSGTRLATIDVVVDLVSTPERSTAVTVVALSPSAGSAARLAAGRFADQVLFAVHELGTHIDELAAVASELMAVEARTHGTVLLPEGRHLTAHPSVGAGAALLRSAPSGATSSAFTGGAVSGARSSALMEVMEDLVTRADDAPAEEVTPAETTEAEVVQADEPRSHFFDRNDREDEPAIAGGDLAQGDVSPTQDERDPDDGTEPESESESEAEFEPGTEAEAEAEPGTEAGTEPQPEAEAEAEFESEPEPEPEPEAEPAPDAEAEAQFDPAPDAEAEDDAPAPETVPVPETDATSASRSIEPGAIQPGANQTGAAPGQTKKKRGRGRGPVQSRRGPGAGPASQTEPGRPPADPASAQSDQGQPMQEEPSAGPTGTGAGDRPVIPANENSWAFTR
ncbi:hypothetical protein [Nocardioides gilvus]|uniref:hypothetical protein n=1 Tax=Nocardioides gilvus TaxID=1735589 RepID=UPI0013A5532B|nr:hypothetical protein [Nocardioides gilvus]